MQSYKTTLDFFREEQFAKELAQNLSTYQIFALIRFGHRATMEATYIKENNLYEEHSVTPKQIDFDLKAIKWNMKQLRYALPLRKKEPIQDFPNGATLILN